MKTHFQFSLLLFEEQPELKPGDEGYVEPTIEDTPAEIKDHAYVKRLNGQLAELRKKQKERDQADADAEKAKLKADNELEKLNKKLEKELDEAKAEFAKEVGARDMRVVNAEIKNMARDLGVKDAALAKVTKLLDFDKIELDDDGEVKGAKEQLEALKEEMPFLFDEEGTTTTTRSTPARPTRTQTTTPAKIDYRDGTISREKLNNAWKDLVKS